MTDEEKRAWLRPIVSMGLQSVRHPHLDSPRSYYTEQVDGVIDALIKNVISHELYEKINALKEEVNALKSENAELHERLERSIELPFFQEDGEARILVYRDKNGIVCTEIYFEDEIYWGRHGDEAAEARLAELKGEKE